MSSYTVQQPDTESKPGEDLQNLHGVDQTPSPVVEDEIARACRRLLNL